MYSEIQTKSSVFKHKRVSEIWTLGNQNPTQVGISDTFLFKTNSIWYLCMYLTTVLYQIALVRCVWYRNSKLHFQTHFLSLKFDILYMYKVTMYSSGSLKSELSENITLKSLISGKEFFLSLEVRECNELNLINFFQFSFLPCSIP